MPASTVLSPISWYGSLLLTVVCLAALSLELLDLGLQGGDVAAEKVLVPGACTRSGSLGLDGLTAAPMVVHLGAQQSQQRRGRGWRCPVRGDTPPVHARAAHREKLSRNVNSALQNYKP